jgi:hypothetical protein
MAVRVVGNHLVIGFGERGHFVSIETKSSKSEKLHMCFGHLYTLGDFDLKAYAFCSLVGSGMHLHCFAAQGDELWKSSQVGINGVVVHEVSPPTIRISGEWDPPEAGRLRPCILRAGLYRFNKAGPDKIPGMGCSVESQDPLYRADVSRWANFETVLNFLNPVSCVYMFVKAASFELVKLVLGFLNSEHQFD